MPAQKSTTKRQTKKARPRPPAKPRSATILETVRKGVNRLKQARIAQKRTRNLHPDHPGAQAKAFVKGLRRQPNPPAPKGRTAKSAR